MRPLGAADRGFRAFANYDEQIKITSFIWLAPGMRAEQPYLLRLELDREAARHLV